MMSDSVYARLIEIGNTPSKNEKVALVAAQKDDDTWKAVLLAALNPLYSYGVKKLLPAVEDRGGVEQFDVHTWTLIGQLRGRVLTGHAARDAIEAEFKRLTIPSQDLLRRVLLKKLDAGFDASTTNKAIPKLIPVFPYMRCSLPKDVKLDAFGWEEGVIAQEKADGLYLNVDHDEASVVRLTSRQGTEYPLDAFEDFVAAVKATFKPGTQTHGEMVVTRDGVILPREDGNGIMSHIESGGSFAPNEQPLFLAWDQIPLTAVVPKGKYTVPYRKRLADLIQQLRPCQTPHLKLIPTKIVKSMAEGWAHYRELLKQGKEGVVLKKPTAIWKDGTSQEQIKLKLEAPVELRVKGFNEGTGKFVGQLGSLICHSECGQLVVNVSGRGDAMRKQVWESKDDWMDAIVTVKGNAIMEPGDSSTKHSLFLPIFVERRTDKDVADDLERIRYQFEAAIAAA